MDVTSGEATPFAPYGAGSRTPPGGSGRPTEPPATAPPRGRSVLVTVILSGLGPGAGHVHVGATRRGALLVGLWIAASLAWTTRAAESWTQARLFALPAILSLLAILIDSGRQAARSPRPFVAASWNRWWTLLAIIALTGFVVPFALQAALEAQAGLAVADDAMAPALQPMDRVVYSRDTRRLARGDVVVAHVGGEPLVRRLVALPGQRAEIRMGHVLADGQPWLEDPARLLGATRLRIPEMTAGRDEVLLVADRRIGPEGLLRVPRDRLVGRASWLLLPADLDPLRVGAPVR